MIHLVKSRRPSPLDAPTLATKASACEIYMPPNLYASARARRINFWPYLLHICLSDIHFFYLHSCPICCVEASKVHIMVEFCFLDCVLHCLKWLQQQLKLISLYFEKRHEHCFNADLLQPPTSSPFRYERQCAARYTRCQGL